MASKSRGLVAAGLVVDDLTRPTKVVVGRRTSPWELAGLWEFPGGKVGPDERPEDALQRELLEELYCQVRVGMELFNPMGGAWPINDELEMRLWWVEPIVEPQLGNDHDEIIWATARELQGLSFVPADHAIAQIVEQHLTRP